MKQDETYLTGMEVQKILKISRTTLYRLTKGSKIKKVKLGGQNRFKLSDIEKAMK